MFKPTVKPLKDMTALLIASTSGIGLESAAQLAEVGVPRVYINGRDVKRGESAIAEIKSRAPSCEVTFLQGDVTELGVADALVSQCGSIDLLVNATPGTQPATLFKDFKPEHLGPLVDAHLASTFFGAHAALPGMREGGGGVIINISSDAAKIPTPGEAVHGALMAAIDMFSRTLALECARYGVRVHALTPSIVSETDSYKRMMDGGFSEKLFQSAVKKAALGVPTPKDIAPLVVFLASPSAARMTGQSITVNGGIAVA